MKIPPRLRKIFEERGNRSLVAEQTAERTYFKFFLSPRAPCVFEPASDFFLTPTKPASPFAAMMPIGSGNAEDWGAHCTAITWGFWTRESCSASGVFSF